MQCLMMLESNSSSSASPSTGRLDRQLGFSCSPSLAPRPPNNLEATKSKRGKPRHAESFLLKDIITFAEEIQFQQGEPFLVDSLVCCSALQAWEAFVDLLCWRLGRRLWPWRFLWQV